MTFKLLAKTNIQGPLVITYLQYKSFVMYFVSSLTLPDFYTVQLMVVLPLVQVQHSFEAGQVSFTKDVWCLFSLLGKVIALSNFSRQMMLSTSSLKRDSFTILSTEHLISFLYLPDHLVCFPYYYSQYHPRCQSEHLC